MTLKVPEAAETLTQAHSGIQEDIKPGGDYQWSRMLLSNLPSFLLLESVLSDSLMAPPAFSNSLTIFSHRQHS